MKKKKKLKYFLSKTVCSCLFIIMAIIQSNQHSWIMGRNVDLGSETLNHSTVKDYENLGKTPNSSEPQLLLHDELLNNMHENIIKV